MSENSPKIEPANSITISLAEIPSVNYETAKGTLIYRLSELVFGSLLAAYVLGFTSFAASALSESGTPIFISYYKIDVSFAIILVQIGTYALISSTYAYLTAAIYLLYHVGILTMPTAAVERSRHDFTIAVTQAILFGVSMLIPQSFFFCVAIVLTVAIFRKRTEFNGLTTHFTAQVQRLKQGYPITVSPGTALRKTEVERALYEEVKAKIEQSGLMGWQQIRRKNYIGVTALFVFGIIAIALPTFPQFPFGSSTVLRLIYGASALGLFVLVLSSTLDTMKQGSRFVYDKDALKNLDDKYRELESKLLTLAQTNS